MSSSVADHNYSIFIVAFVYPSKSQIENLSLLVFLKSDINKKKLRLLKMLPYTTGPEVEQYYRHFALFLNNIMYLMIFVFNF